MAEPAKIKIDYQSPASVEAEVPGAQKIREAQFDSNDIEESLSKNGKTGEITQNNGENTQDNRENVKEHPTSSESIVSSFVTEVTGVADGKVTTRHRQVFSGKRNGIHGEPVMMEDRQEDKKARTKIPVSRFRQTVEKVTAERRRSKDKIESHIPVRRTSIPKPSSQKPKSKTVKNEITVTKIETRKESTEPTVTKTEFRKESANQVIAIDVANQTTEPDDEFDKIYADLVVNTPTEVVLDDNLLNPDVEDPEKLESKFEEIIHDYDEHKVEPIDVEVVKRSKIPFLKRKSQQEVELSAQADRTSKIIAARDKLRLRHSSTKDDNFEDELDKELNKVHVNTSNERASGASPSEAKTEKAFKHEVISSPNSRTEREIEHEVTTSPDSKTEVTRQFTKTVSTSSTNEKENVDSTSIIETTTVKEVRTSESNDKKENKQQLMTEENIIKNSIRIGIPVFDSYIHEFSEINETAKTVEVKKVLSYTSKTEDLSIANKTFKTNNEFKEPKIEPTNDKINREDSKANTNLENINNKSMSFDIVESATITANTEDQNITKTTIKDDGIQLRSKVENIINKIDSKEVIETEMNKRESINELTKKKSVLSKIAMFEKKETESVLTRAPKKETKLPKLITKDWQKDHVHIHTPLIVDEVFKPFEADIDLNNKTNKRESLLKRYAELTAVIGAERVTVESRDTVHYAVENNIQTESKPIVHISQIIDTTPAQVINSQYTVQKVEMATITDIPSKEPRTNELPPSKEYDKSEINDVESERSTRLSVTKELQAPIIIPGFRPVSELLRSFESKKEASRSLPKRTVSKVEAVLKSTVIETPLKMPEVIQFNEEKTSITDTSCIAYQSENYNDFESINDYKSLDDVFTKESDFNRQLKYEEDLRRAKSLAELDIGDEVKGKVNNMILRMKSVDRIELDKKEIINKKEMPRKRSVSEKIALFEGKLTPSKGDSPLPLRIFKPDKSTEVPRTEKNIERTLTTLATLTSTTNHCRVEKSVTENEKTEDKSDEEVIQKKIEDLVAARNKYGIMESMPVIELSNGMNMPVLAVGTALLDPRLAYYIVTAAIDLGYRAFDTAYIYGNEKTVGNAITAKIADGTVKREDLFIISKLWSTYHRTDLVEVACKASLEAMGLNYFDLYLIHNPMSFKEGGGPIPKIATVIQYSEYDYLDAWYGMERLVTTGLVRAIGVSNFNSVQVQRVLDKGRIKPVINQVECHPYLSQHRLDVFCSERNVTLSCFGVLGSKGTPAELKSGQSAAIDDPLIQVMASGLGITPAQLLISYQLDSSHGVVVKSSSADHLWSNLQAVLIHLTPGQVDALNALNRNKRTFTFKGMGDTHKNYPFNIAF